MDSNDFLMGGGGGSVKFDAIGDTVTGTIVSIEVRQQTSLEDGKPLVWDNGDPKMQLVVTLATDLRDDGDDDGHRNLYVKGSKQPGSQSLHDAVRAAVQAAHVKGLAPGGTLTVSYVGEEPSKTRGFNARKLYEASYVAPDVAAATGDFLGTAPATPATGFAKPVEPAAAESPAVKAKKLAALGLTPEQIGSQLGLDASVVSILVNA
jgi:hypothetical protein